MQNYISAAQAALKWNVSVRQAQRLLKSGRIENAKKFGNSWLIPAETPKPSDPRIGKKITREPDYVPYVYISSVIPMPEKNAEAVLEEIPDEGARKQYEAEINYLKGNFAAVKEYCRGVTEDSPFYICACAEAMTSAVNSADYPTFVEAENKLKKLIAETKNEDSRLAAQTALATLHLSLYAPENAPEWIKNGDFTLFSAEARPWAVYLYTKYMQNTGQFRSQLAAANTAVTLCSPKRGFTVLDIYFRLMCAAALNGTGDREGVKKWLGEAIELALPNGFVTPFRETVMMFGGALEECVENEWPEYYDEIAGQPDNLWTNWISFHNIIVHENITLVLTKQEYRLAQHLVNGATYAEAALRMNLSVGRIKNLVSVIYSKLYINSGKQLKDFIL